MMPLVTSVLIGGDILVEIMLTDNHIKTNKKITNVYIFEYLQNTPIIIVNIVSIKVHGEW